MKHILTAAVLQLIAFTTWGQGFWAPGACWIYDEYGLPDLTRITYVSDTLIDGYNAQKLFLEPCFETGDGLFECGDFNGPYYNYTTVQGDVVLERHWTTTGWDTLYWLGSPGDRWWSFRSEETCPGPYGMIGIADTGQVVIDGIQLRTWEIGWVDADGIVHPSASEPWLIIERIGEVPRICPFVCSAIYDCFYGPFVHYSDNEIDLFDNGWSCDIPMQLPEADPVGHIRVQPNPGNELFSIGGVDRVVLAEVRDALGRMVHRGQYAPGASIVTADWPSGVYSIALHDRAGIRTVLPWTKQ